MFNALFRDMDLYKGIVLASLVVLPVGGYVLYAQQQRIELAQRECREAVQRNGQLERIGLLYKQLETLEKSSRRGGEIAAEEPDRYFQTQITENSVSQLGASDIAIKEGAARARGGRGEASVKDTVIEIQFLEDGKKGRPLNQDQINSILYNCESQSQGVWKLYQLAMKNIESGEFQRGKKSPPVTVADKWSVDKLEFIKREPDKSGSRSRGGRRVRSRSAAGG